MAEERLDRPYAQFNFEVQWDGVKAGFQEVSGLGLEIQVAEYRAGNSKEKGPLKVTTLYKVPDITLKRGVVGAMELFEWIKEVRDGKQDQRKTVTIILKDETGTKDAMKWTLKEARPTKYTGPSLNGKGNEIAIEELTLACEQIDWG